MSELRDQVCKTDSLTRACTRPAQRAGCRVTRYSLGLPYMGVRMLLKTPPFRAIAGFVVTGLATIVAARRQGFESHYWLPLAISTSGAVLVWTLLFEFAYSRKWRWLSWTLVCFSAVFLLFAGQIAEYWPDRQLIQEGWILDHGPFRAIWPFWCGTPVLVVLSFLRRGSRNKRSEA